MKNENDFKALMEAYRQTHILGYLEKLPPDKKKNFLKNAAGLNFKLVFTLHKNHCSGPEEKTAPAEGIKPPVLFTPHSAAEKKEILEAGEMSILGGETAVMIVAGGDATRLGYPYPKGMYPVSPLKGKSLFELLSEKVKAVSLKYNRKIPLLIMTNPENCQTIKNFFTKHGFFGLDRNSIFFFSQEILPSITPEGRLILKNAEHIVSNPDGHGGSLKAIWESGLLQKLEKRGVKKIFYCHIDNPLVKVLDPFFLGCHITKKADFSLKTVKKLPDEKVGTFVYSGGKASVVEYIEIPEILKEAKNRRGELIFNKANIGVHIINTGFISSLNKKGFALPYHRQRKKVALPDTKKMEIWKFETFVFDAMPFAKKVLCIETKREEEFAPLKNKEGKDSPAEVKQKMVSLYKTWLNAAGIEIKADAAVEISPLFACSKKEFIMKMKGKKAAITKNIYIK